MKYRHLPCKYICILIGMAIVLLSGCEQSSSDTVREGEGSSEYAGDDISREQPEAERDPQNEAEYEAVSDREDGAETGLDEAPAVESLTESGTYPTEETLSETVSEYTAESVTEYADEDLTEAGTETETEHPAVHPSVNFIPGVEHLIPGYAFMQQHDLPLPPHTLNLLRLSLEQMLASYDGVWSVSVRDLTTSEQIVIHDIAMPSASVMKLFILGCVYEDIRTGTLTRTSELVDQMGSMIRSSSNEAANRILKTLGGGDYAVGIEHVNQYIRQAGYSDLTHAYNPFNDEAIRLDEEHVNQTSAADCAELLERIYRRRFATRTACNEAEQFLLNQETRFKIPSMVPDSASVANKTGETETIENDVAIVYTPSGDYILTVFSTGWADKKLAQQRIKQISAQVYAYHTDPDYASKVFPYLAHAYSSSTINSR